MKKRFCSCFVFQAILVQPSILSCIGDIALAITGNFEKYLGAVMVVLQQASQTRLLDQTDLDFVDYIDNLREGVFEAYSGILHGLSTAKKVQLMAPYMQHAVAFVEFLAKVSTFSQKLRSFAEQNTGV
jgi:importin subunit beta-1